MNGTDEYNELNIFLLYGCVDLCLFSRKLFFFSVQLKGEHQKLRERGKRERAREGEIARARERTREREPESEREISSER